MSAKRNWHNVKGTWAGFFIGFVFLVFLAVVSFGQVSEKKFPDYYPKKFDTIGTIDRIAEDEIVIGDILFGLSPNTTYHTPLIKDASKALFPVGSRVGLKTNLKREVTSLFLLE